MTTFTQTLWRAAHSFRKLRALILKTLLYTHDEIQEILFHTSNNNGLRDVPLAKSTNISDSRH